MNVGRSCELQLIVLIARTTIKKRLNGLGKQKN